MRWWRCMVENAMYCAGGGKVAWERGVVGTDGKSENGKMANRKRKK